MPHRRLSLKETAAYLHIAEPDLAKLVHHGEIPFERRGAAPVFVKKDVDVWASRRIMGFAEKGLEDYHRRSSARVHDLSDRHAIMVELMRPAAVEPALASRTKPAVLRDLAALAEKTGLVIDAKGLADLLREREELCSTGMPGGLALLHPRHHDPYMFEDSFIALGRAVQPVPFGAPDGNPTDLFFLVCCQDDRIHLHVLARLCLMCVRTKLLADLRAAADHDALIAAIERAEMEVIKGI